MGANFAVFRCFLAALVALCCMRKCTVGGVVARPNGRE